MPTHKGQLMTTTKQGKEKNSAFFKYKNDNDVCIMSGESLASARITVKANISYTICPPGTNWTVKHVA